MQVVPQVRLPLQIGTSSLWSLARCSATLLPGLGLLPVGLLVMASGSGGSNVKAGLGVMVIAVLLTIFSVMHIRLSIRNRPSDVLLTKDGIQIEGGPYGGRRYTWAELNEFPSNLFDTEESRITILGILRSLATRDGEMGMSDIRVLKLQLRLANGEEMIVAEAERPIEQDSLRALHDSLRSGNWRGDKQKDPRQGAMQARAKQQQQGIHVLTCQQCGAAVAPDDKPSATCRFCRFQMAVPHETQERVRAARQVSGARAVTEKLIVGLLQQPGADRTNKLLLFFGIPMMLVWPLAFAIGAVRGLLRDIEFIDFLWLGLFPLATILALFFVLRAQLADRQALRLLTLNFGAKEPARPGDPYTCRSCDAPLPDSPGNVVVKCAYCAADNILGLDLRREAAPATEEAKGLEDAVAQRSQERFLWRALTGVAGVLLLLGVGSLAMGLGVTEMVADDSKGKPGAAATTPAKGKAPPPATPPPPATKKH
jgi:hypothetical protein